MTVRDVGGVVKADQVAAGAEVDGDKGSTECEEIGNSAEVGKEADNVEAFQGADSDDIAPGQYGEEIWRQGILGSSI